VSDAALEPARIPTDPEDLKLITLARAALGRTGAAQGASVRDIDGRTYAAASVNLEHLELSAIAVAVAMAASSGASGLEAAALVAMEDPSAADRELVGDLAVDGAVIWRAEPDGAVRSVIELR
jgi:hypothetical protein